LRGGSYFREGKFPLLDDGFILHFVPHFSPISGHLWMMRAALAADESARLVTLSEPPWKKLNPLWVPKNVQDINTNIDQWWLHLENAPSALRVWARVVAFALCLLIAGAAATLLRHLMPGRSRSAPTGAGEPA
jgi:hypothetical protein